MSKRHAYLLAASALCPIVTFGAIPTTAIAADNALTVTVGTGTTMRSGDVGTGVQSPFVIIGNTTGTAVGTTTLPFYVGATSAAIVDGAIVTLGTTGDAAWAGSGSGSANSVLKAIYGAVVGSVPAGTAVIGGVTLAGGTGLVTLGGGTALVTLGGGTAVLAGGTTTVTLAGGTATVGAATRTGLTPTITTTPGYSVGDCVGGFQVATVANVNGQSGFITGMIVRNLTATTPTLVGYLFDANPAASTCTDNGTFAINTADMSKLMTVPLVISLALATGMTTATYGSATIVPPQPFIAGGTTGSGVRTIYVALVAGTAFTAVTTSDLIVSVGAALN